MNREAIETTADPKRPPVVARPPWCPDRADGRYVNPILFADYSDPDAIRVGADYWMTASSFCHVPGLPILHSRDLINWRLVNHALPRLVPAAHYAVPRPGCGVWAPAIRHHAGRFWIFYPDPDFGIHVITADDPGGVWSPPLVVKAGQGLIDPCPWWDDDGTAWLIHGWAHSRAGIHNVLTLHRMAPDGTGVRDGGQIVIDGHQLPGWTTLEGPKLYRRNGWYWIFAPAGGVATGYQAVFRARDIRGPYEPRVVLAQGTTTVNGPHQGAWVDTPGGEHWFLHFQERQPFGRVVHLQPMYWRDDDWPVMGHDPDASGQGEPVLTHAKPSLPAGDVIVPPTSDDFSGPELGLQWQWQANPDPAWASLTATPGALRLACVPRAENDSHWLAGHLLLQKFPAPTFEATTILRFSPDADGDTAGLIVFGYDYAWLGLRRTGPTLRLVFVTCSQAQQGGRETTDVAVEGAEPVAHLRVQVSETGACRFSWSTAGVAFTPIGEIFQATESRWVGAKVGLFASAAPDSRTRGEAEFDSFLVR